MNIALIAHDKKKLDLIVFCKENESFFSGNKLIATGTTGLMIQENTNLKVNCLKSGPLGGDQEIGSKIANGEIDLVFFFRDPLTAQPHEPDVNALLRLCDVYEIPLATNKQTAYMIVNHKFDTRSIKKINV